MEAPAVTFRADASVLIGTGHVMRCLTLADALRERGSVCAFICRDHEGNLADLIRARGYPVTLLPSGPPDTLLAVAGYEAWLGGTWEADAAATVNALIKVPVDWLVIDHYGIDQRWERAVRPAAARILVLDDLANRSHDCDVLVDPGVDRDLPRKYASLTSARCLRLVGPKFANLRPEFERERRTLSRIERPQIPRRIVVMFGGSDLDGSTMGALRAIEQIPAPQPLAVDVILSRISQDAERVVELCRQHTNYVVHRNINDVASILARADLAIGSGGGATFERLYLRLPSILKVIADNQRVPLSHMQQLGLIEIYETDDELAAILGSVMTSGVVPPPDVVENGVPAICGAIADLTVSLRPPVAPDLRRTFRWLQDVELRRQFVMKDKPQRRRHFEYWRRLLADVHQRVYSIYCGDKHVGNAGIRNFERGDGAAELWLYLGSTSQRGQGLGAIALKYLENIAKSELASSSIVLHVLSGNEAALNLYRRAGYKVVDDVSADAAWPADVILLEKSL